MEFSLEILQFAELLRAQYWKIWQIGSILRQISLDCQVPVRFARIQSYSDFFQLPNNTLSNPSSQKHAVAKLHKKVVHITSYSPDGQEEFGSRVSPSSIQAGSMR